MHIILGQYVTHKKKNISGVVTKICPKKFAIDSGVCKWYPNNFFINPPTLMVNLDDKHTAVVELYRFLFAIQIPIDMNFLSFKTERHSNILVFHFETDYVETYNCEPNCPDWDAIQCTETSYPFKTDCKDKNGNVFKDNELNRTNKLFIQGFSNFLDYVRAIKSNKITKYYHRHVWNKILSILSKHTNWTVINHNRDVNTLHFKFEKSSPKEFGVTHNGKVYWPARLHLPSEINYKDVAARLRKNCYTEVTVMDMVLNIKTIDFTGVNTPEISLTTRYKNGYDDSLIIFQMIMKVQSSRLRKLLKPFHRQYDGKFDGPIKADVIFSNNVIIKANLFVDNTEKNGVIIRQTYYNTYSNDKGLEKTTHSEHKQNSA